MNDNLNNLNILTFDIEEWFHANYGQVCPCGKRSQNSNFKSNMETILKLCKDTGCKATFFVLGSIGEDYPDVVRAIAEDGHEVASHGYAHQLAYGQTFAEFKADVKKSVDILQDITGVSVKGYRAPSWSITESNFYYLEALVELGLAYDASIFPVKTFLYGIPDAPTQIHRPLINNKEIDLYEIPMSIVKLFGRNIGYSGGFYFRFFPLFFIKKAIALANKKGQSSIIYLHPREIDPNEQRLSLGFKETFIHYYNVSGTKSKLESIMKSFEFISISDYLKREQIKISDRMISIETNKS